MKNISLKLILLSLIAGAAFVPQETNTMNWNNLTIIGGGIAVIYTATKLIGQKILNQRLLSAAESGDLKMVENYLYYGANIEAENVYRRTPLIIACRYEHTEIAELLINAGANIEAEDDRGWTPLIYASYYGNFETIKYLIKKGANIETKDDRGWTLLIYACSLGNTKIAELLINSGANIKAKDKNGLTAYDHTLRSNNQEIANYLFSIQNELIEFKNKPTKWTITAPRIPNAPKSAFLKILYNNHIYYTDTVKYTDLSFIFALFQKHGKNEELKKILEECKFLNCNKEQLKKLYKIGFPLSGQELAMQENLLKNLQESTYFDLNLFYNKNVIQNNQNNNF